jgi:dTDP-4-dehydrorhamnose 3,5-epimerase
MKLHTTSIPGCFEVEAVQRLDTRGSFVKTFRATSFRELGLEAAFTESFYSTSQQNVIRGMHFQMPPADGAKLIYCLQGEVLDVALDLRVGSPAFGNFATFQLSPERANLAYIPRGVAHGFLTTAGPATLVYNVSSEYDPQLDAGILWNSFAMDWPIAAPQLSDRDRNLPVLEAFQSPFLFAPTEVSA